jgi:hypothetical protein
MIKTFILVVNLFIFSLIVQSQSPYRDLSFSEDGLFEFENGGSVSSLCRFDNAGRTICVRFAADKDSPEPDRLVYEIARYLPNHEPDLTFGNNGHVRYSFPTTGQSFYSQPVDILLQPNGKIIIVDHHIFQGLTYQSPWYGSFGYTAYRTFLFKLNADGSADLGFGQSDGGLYVNDYLTNSAYLSDEGNIYLAGKGYTPSAAPSITNPNIYVFNYNWTANLKLINNNGTLASLPSGFGSINWLGGLVPEEYTSVAEVNNKLLVGGQFRSQFDPIINGFFTFDLSNNTAITPMNATTPVVDVGEYLPTQIDVVNGKFNIIGLLSGNYDFPTQGNILINNYFFASDLMIGRYNSDASWDMSFNGDGIMYFSDPEFEISVRGELELDNSGNIYIGAVKYSNYMPIGCSIFSINSLGVMNSNFSMDGIADFSPTIKDVLDIHLIDSNIICNCHYASGNYNGDVDKRDCFVHLDENGSIIQSIGDAGALVISNTFGVEGLYVNSGFSIGNSDNSQFIARMMDDEGVKIARINDSGLTEDSYLLYTAVPTLTYSTTNISIPINESESYSFFSQILFADDNYIFGSYSQGLGALHTDFSAVVPIGSLPQGAELKSVCKFDGNYYVFYRLLNVNVFGVLKLTSELLPATDFGQNGIASIDLLGTDWQIYLNHYIDDTGIYIAGYREGYGFPMQSDKLFISKLNTNGSLDLAWGDYGNLVVLTAPQIVVLSSLGVGPGQFYFFVSTGNIIELPSQMGDSFELFRTDANGEVDATFGTDGFIYSERGDFTTMILGPDQHIYFVNNVYDTNPNSYYTCLDCNSRIRRMTLDGTIDEDFEIKEELANSSMHIDEYQRINEFSGLDLGDYFGFGLNSESLVDKEQFSKIAWNADSTKIYAYGGLNSKIYRFLLEMPVYGCMDPLSANYNPDATVDDQSCFVMNMAVEEPTCFGEMDGSIDLNISGSLTGYSVNWSNGMSGESISGIGSGSYEYEIINQDGEFVYDGAVNVESPSPLIWNHILVQPTIVAPCAGQLALIISGGTPPYEVFWSDPQYNGQTQVDYLCSGQTLEATIVDANGCTTSTSIFTILNTLNQSWTSDEIQIYPVPSDEFVHVRLQTLQNFENWRILNAAGVVIAEGIIAEDKKESNIFIIDTSSLASGVYCIELISDSITGHRAFIKR